nr:MAG TPA: hypothetical protein [Caudoviricetes sp.]
MASTTYEHLGNVTAMYAAQRRFRDFTKMVCDFVKVDKIDHLGNVAVMVRNAGQLPQPFWLGAACGGGSRGAARCAART